MGGKFFNLMGFCCLVGLHSVLPARSDISPVVVDFFYESGCPECTVVSREILPALQDRYPGLYSLRRHDTGITSNLVMLIAYQNALGVTENSSVSVFLDYSRALCGADSIRNEIFACMDDLIARHGVPDWQPPPPITAGHRQITKIAHNRISVFTLSSVILGGLLDGINPCAISTLVFFMSLLLITSRKRPAVLMGISFCIASFVTYTAVGFGLLRCIHVLDFFPALKASFEIGMVFVLLLLAFLSFRDALRYKRNYDPKQISLQLPNSVRTIIHSLMRRSMKKRSLIIAGLVVGALVTILETVCTGQVYLPTMTLVLKNGYNSKALGMLVLYNLMFILPLVMILVLVRYGLTTKTMLEWSRKNVVFSKTLLGLFFVVLSMCFLFLAHNPGPRNISGKTGIPAVAGRLAEATSTPLQSVRQALAHPGVDSAPVSVPTLVPHDPSAVAFAEKSVSVSYNPADISKAVSNIVNGVRNKASYTDYRNAMRKLTRNLSPADIHALMLFLKRKAAECSDDIRPIAFNGVKNDVLDVLLRQNTLPPNIGALIVEMYNDKSFDTMWRDYSLQALADYYARRWIYPWQNRKQPPGADLSAAELETIKTVYTNALAETHNGIAGTALLGLAALMRNNVQLVDIGKLRAITANMIIQPETDEATRITALRMAASLNVTGILPEIEIIAQTGETLTLRMAAIATLGDIGTSGNIELLTSLSSDSDPSVRSIAARALEKITNTKGPQND